MTRLLFLSTDAEVREALPRHLRAAFPSWSVECATSIGDVIDACGASDLAAVIAHCKLRPIDAAALIVASSRGQPGKAVFTVSGGDGPDATDFLMLVRIPDAAHPFHGPVPMESVVGVLRGLIDATLPTAVHG